MCDRLEKWKHRQRDRLEWFARGRDLRTATEEKEILPVAGRSQGALFGQLVHRLLERIDWKHPTLLEQVAAAEAPAIGADPAMVEEAVEMIRTALASDLMKHIAQADRYFKEVPFTFEDEGAIVEGLIDVLFEEAGKIGIVDFKTDRVPKSKVADKAEQYRPQVETYRRAVTAACGTPPEEVILFFLHTMQKVVVRPEL
jgi:ATP-dependent exoDNAse (exonuclease V) beta subunit